MRRAWLLTGCAAAVLAAWPVTMNAIGARTSAAGTSQCASLGEAANYGIFSDGVFNASRPEGTSINGRVAAAGDVTLANLSMGPSVGDASPTLVTAGNLNLTGNYGSLNGGARVQGAINSSPNFSVNPPATNGAPGFSFTTEFQKLNELSAYWATLPSTPDETVSPPSGPNTPLSLTGTHAGVNVFNVSSASMALAAGIIVTLTQPGATALINITGTTPLAIDAQYFTLSGVSADRLVWNFGLVPQLTINRGLGWSGLIMAPNADISAANGAQINGSIVARSFPVARWVVNRAATTACLPVPAPKPPTVDPTLSMRALCIDGTDALDMVLTNTGDTARTVHWADLHGSDYGDFVVPPHNDFFFRVRGGGAASVIHATTAEGTVAEANGTGARCRGFITVRKATTGDAPAGAKWAITVSDGQHGVFTRVVTLGSGQSTRLGVPGGYQPGAAPINSVVGGVVYTVSEADPQGGVATVTGNPIEILDGQDALATVTNAYPETGGGGGGGGGGTEPPIEPPIAPPQPTIPPGAPAPLPGPDFVASESSTGAPDLVTTHVLTPSRVLAGGTVQTVTHVRNDGDAPAVGAVMRDLPQYPATDPNNVAVVQTVSTSHGTCTHVRPLRCELGTLAPGEDATITTKATIQIAAQGLRSVVLVSSETPESNTTNNMDVARLSSFDPKPALRVGVNALPLARVGHRLRYRVVVSGDRPDGASFVRLCSPPPGTLVEVKAPGTYAYQGARCRNVLFLGLGRTVGFTISGVPAKGGRLIARAKATAVGLARPERDAALIRVLGPAACAASVKTC